MNNLLTALDEHFCAHYSNYVKITALAGYKMPNVLYIAGDGNIARKDSSLMRLCHQEKKDELLKTFKEGRVDTSFTFSFFFPSFKTRLKNIANKYTFAKLLPQILSHTGETVESAGEKLDIEPRFWKKIVKGRVYPEKNTILALALVCRMQKRDVEQLLVVSGFSLDSESVNDVVVEYLILQQIFNEELRDCCLKEYKITNLPIKRA